MKILLVGGGSGGSVSPLIAVASALKAINPRVRFLFVGGKKGPEEQMSKAAGLPFAKITSGRFRRYFSLKNLGLPFLLLAGFWQAKKILSEFKPDAVFAAGSFVQVPVAWAARFKKIPIVLHQQDLLPGLANKLCQGAAQKITVTFEKSLTDFESGLGLFYKKPANKVVLTGNPFRRELAGFTKEQGLKFFFLRSDLPTLLVLGGGTGAEGLNQIVIRALPKLTQFIQVIHVSGSGKSLAKKSENYLPYEFLQNMGEAYAAADIVLSRCGLSTLTELSNLKKVSILVPMPNSHQEINGLLLKSFGAGLVAAQKDLSPGVLPKLLRDVLFNYNLQKHLSERIGQIMPHNAAEKIAKIIIKTVQDAK